jgi:hypothetical protein
MRFRQCFAAVLLLAFSSGKAEEAPTTPSRTWIGLPFPAPLDVSLNAEIGFLGVLSHVIQLGRNGTLVDYVHDGGQNNLYAFTRFSADVTYAQHHTFTALYQPLDLQTQELLRRDIVVNDQRFPAGTPMRFGYGFPFWRLSYMYDFEASPDEELAIGASLQLRDATITFASQDGTLLRTEQNIGPVPLVKFRGRHTFSNRMWVGGELDGIYAAGRGITGSRNDFIGSLLDASLRAGMELTPAADIYLNVRVLAGGAKGTDESFPPPGDGFTRNWLYTMTVSLGFQLKAARSPR